MLREAHRLSDAHTFYMISGHAYPIKPLGKFLKFFEQNQGINYVAYGQVIPVGFSSESFCRTQYFFPYDYAGTGLQSAQKTSLWVKWQRKLHVNRGFPTQFDKLYCGFQWFSVSRQAANSIIGYSHQHRAFYRRLKFIYAPEETYSLTILPNLCNPMTIINKNCRFIRWHKEKGNSPANLSTELFHLLAETEDLFARKAVSPYWKDLVALIGKYLLTEYMCEVMPDGTCNSKSFPECSYGPGLTGAMFNYCNMPPCYEILEIGCWPGLYVAALRRLGLFAVGIDSNPQIEEFSRLLLPKGDTPCQCGNITSEVETEGTFGLVMCLNILQHIANMTLYKKAVDNIISLSGQTIVTDMAANDGEDNERRQYFAKRLADNGFVENRFASAYFTKCAKRYGHIYVLEKISIRHLAYSQNNTSLIHIARN